MYAVPCLNDGVNNNLTKITHAGLNFNRIKINFEVVPVSDWFNVINRYIKLIGKFRYWEIYNQINI